MGLFSSIIHVRDAKPDAVSKALTEIVPGWGFEFAEERAMTSAPQDEPADGLLYLVSPLRSRWAAILEGHFAVEDAPPLANLAKSLSRALATYAVALMVHDDDVLYCNLCHAGSDLDGYNSNPQYFEMARLDDESIAQQRHDPRSFVPILPEGVQISQLQAILDRGWWSALDGGRLDEDGVPPEDEPGFVFEGERLTAIGNLLQLHGTTEDYPFGAGLYNTNINWPAFRELRFIRASNG